MCGFQSDRFFDGRQILLDPVGPSLTHLGPLDALLGFVTGVTGASESTSGQEIPLTTAL
jgi:hypothetical protein